MDTATVALSGSGVAESIEKLQSGTRGCIKPSTEKSLSFDGRKWIFMNLALFTLPSILLPLLLFECDLLHFNSRFDVLGLVFLCFFGGCLNLVAGLRFFPSLVAYERILGTYAPGFRRHRTHWSYITPRRWRQYFSATIFTIFVLGLLRNSLPLSVTRATTISGLNEMLASHSNPFVRVMTRPNIHYFETVESFPRRLAPEMSIASAGILPDSHIRFKIAFLGGASSRGTSASANAGASTSSNQMAQAGPSQASSSSSSRPVRQSNQTRLQAALAEERLDENGDTAALRPTKRPRARKPKPKTHSDDETEYETDSGSASETDDSGIEIVMGNSELADSLPAKTLPAGARRRTGKARHGKRRKTASTLSDGEEDALPSLPQVQLSKPSKRAGKTTNPIYYFYKRVDTDEDGTVIEGTRYYKCCHGSQKVVKITKAMKGNLNNLVGHLQRTFPAHYRLYEVLSKRDGPPSQEERDVASGTKKMDDTLAKRYLNELETISQNIRDMFEAQRAKGQEPWDQARFEELVAKWIAACDQPFSAVEEPEFRELLEYVHRFSTGKLKIPNRKSVAKRIMDMEEEMIEGFRAMFKENTSNFALSLDAWTSSNGHAFMAIIIHFINNTGKLEECLIDFRELIGQHSGENMAESVWKTMELYGLKGRITAFVMDNATNNDTLVEHFAKKCAEESIDFDAGNARMRCMPHTIHLAALQVKLLEAIGGLSGEGTTSIQSTPYQDTTTESVNRSQDEFLVEHQDDDDDSDKPADTGLISLAVFKLRKIVRYVRSSPQQRQKYLTEVQRSMNNSEIPVAKLVMLILDVRTRWSSTHQMLRRAYDFKDVIDNYAARNIREHELDEEEWKALEYVMTWLKTFREATTQMSATKQSMLSTTHAMFRTLQDELKSILSSLPDDIDTSLKQGLVDSHRKLSDYFEKFDQSDYYHWAALLDPRIAYGGLAEDYADDPDLMASLELARERLQRHYDFYYHASSMSPSTTTTPDNLRSPRKNFAERYTKKRTAAAADRNELKDFFRLTNDMPLDMKADPIAWWHARRETFPNLYRLVRDVLCIPGSAVAVERIFSGGRDLIGIRRASLKAETIRSLMLVKAQLRLRRKAITDLIGDD